MPTAKGQNGCEVMLQVSLFLVAPYAGGYLRKVGPRVRKEELLSEDVVS